MRAVRGLTILGLALVMMGHTPGAWACSCPLPSSTSALELQKQTFKQADVVFVGTVVSSEDTNTGDVISSGDPIIWTFKVQSTQKGETDPTTTVTSARDSATCGFVFTVGKRYQVYAQETSDGLTTGVCSGTRVLAAGEAGFRISGSGLAHTGRSALVIALPLLAGALIIGGLVLVREARRRAVFTWPR